MVSSWIEGKWGDRRKGAYQQVTEWPGLHSVNVSMPTSSIYIHGWNHNLFMLMYGVISIVIHVKN